MSGNTTVLDRLAGKLSLLWIKTRTSNITLDLGETSKSLPNPVEGPAMLTIGILGVLFNVLCLAVLSHKKKLKLSSDYLRLLYSQSLFDLLYIISSTPLTALSLFQHQLQSLVILPWIFPFVQIAMTASIYNTIALTIERYLSVRDISITRPFPSTLTICAIIVFSISINIPRFFELTATTEEKMSFRQVNDTGNLLHDFELHTMVQHSVMPTAEFYTVGYFLGYNIIGSLLISLLVPMVTLSVLNLLIWSKLSIIWHSRSHLGISEKQNMNVTLSLAFAVVMFFICHLMKLVVSGYQLLDALISPEIPLVWPYWVDICTFVSHFLLAINASMNIVFFSSCNKMFFLTMQGMFKSWYLLITTGVCTKLIQGDEVVVPCGISNDRDGNDSSVMDVNELKELALSAKQDRVESSSFEGEGQPQTVVQQDEQVTGVAGEVILNEGDENASVQRVEVHQVDELSVDGDSFSKEDA